MVKRVLPAFFYEGASATAEEVDQIMGEYLSTPKGRAQLLESCSVRIEGWLATEPPPEDVIRRLVRIVDFVLEAVADDEILNFRLLVPFFRAKKLYPVA